MTLDLEHDPDCDYCLGWGVYWTCTEEVGVCQQFGCQEMPCPCRPEREEDSPCPEPCCTCCNGTGWPSSAYSDGSPCWDCRGTGHAHP